MKILHNPKLMNEREGKAYGSVDPILSHITT